MYIHLNNYLNRSIINFRHTAQHPVQKQEHLNITNRKHLKDKTALFLFGTQSNENIYYNLTSLSVITL